MKEQTEVTTEAPLGCRSILVRVFRICDSSALLSQAAPNMGYI